MNLNHVEAFIMGFALATVLYFIISGMAWIEALHGMEREDSLALVDRIDGKTMNEVSEMLREGHKRQEEKDFAEMQQADTVSNSLLIATEIERLSRELIKSSLVEGRNSAKEMQIN